MRFQILTSFMRIEAAIPSLTERAGGAYIAFALASHRI